MDRKKSLQKQLAFQTIHNVSDSKMGQAILKKNPYETRVLTDKLEHMDFHKRKWKNDFCGRVNDTRQEFKQTRSMENLSRVRSYHGATDTTRPRVSGKPNVGIYRQLGKTSEADATSRKEPTLSAASKEGAIASISGKKKTLTTDIKVYLNDKMLRSEGNSGKDERDRARGSVTPNCMTPFIRHSFADSSDRIATGDVTKWQQCKNCASMVVREEAETQEKDDCDAETPCISVPRQESKTLLKNIVTKEYVFVPTPPPPTQKQNHIWSTRVGEIIWKRRVVSGFLKREKISNLIRGEGRVGHSLSPVEDARFIGLQSLLVPVKNNTRKFKDKVEPRE